MSLSKPSVNERVDSLPARLLMLTSVETRARVALVLLALVDLHCDTYRGPLADQELLRERRQRHEAHIA